MQTVIEKVDGQATQTTNPTPKSRFGSGTYSNLGQECFSDLKRIFGMTEDVAEIAAKRIMSDVGAVMSQANREMKVGKANKDGKVTVKESVTAMKGQTMTMSLYCLRAINFANDASNHGLDMTGIVWSADEKLNEWFDGLK